jgi:UDP-N-acetylmuramate dehydrogenase
MNHPKASRFYTPQSCLPMLIEKDYSLKKYNTFGIDVKAKLFIVFDSEVQLQEILRLPEVRDQKKLILGGGSNILFTRDFDGIVLKNNITGITQEPFDEDHTIVTAGAGEKWHALVLYCLRQGLAGIENLSLIPGTVGAAPLQNIGAYGVELKDVFHSLRAVETATGKVKEFVGEECRFGYRDSIFKQEAKDKYIVTTVSLILRKTPIFNTSYGAIKATLEEMQVKELTIDAISEAVCRIRQSKLPDPARIGNAGSFFKNPEIPRAKFEELKQQYPDIPGYVISEEVVKVPAGWLIEQCGWKGKQLGNYGVHKDQALVLVNYGGAAGEKLRDLAWEIVDSVEQEFGIRLHPEVNIL